MELKDKLFKSVENITMQSTCNMSHTYQGRRKQFVSGQANQLENCVHTEFRVMSGHIYIYIYTCKLLCEAH